MTAVFGGSRKGYCQCASVNVLARFADIVPPVGLNPCASAPSIAVLKISTASACESFPARTRFSSSYAQILGIAWAPGTRPQYAPMVALRSPPNSPPAKTPAAVPAPAPAPLPIARGFARVRASRRAQAGAQAPFFWRRKIPDVPASQEQPADRVHAPLNRVDLRLRSVRISYA